MNQQLANQTPFQGEEADPAFLQQELFEVIVKAGRRCAYDLRHAGGQLTMNPQTREEGKLFEARAQMWLTIFDPANGPKDYRSRLHDEIDRLELEVSRLRRKLGLSEDDSMFSGLEKS